LEGLGHDVGTGKRGGQVSELNCVESVVARFMY
jgi:hypothetical protein